MKNKILYGIMAFVMGIFMTGCSDDDYSVNKNPLLDNSSVVTGSADVTATSATFHGTVKGLEDQAASAYATGFMYGDSETNLSEKASASSDAEFSATITGMPGQVVYYQAFVTLQGRLTYKGAVQQAVLTDAMAITGEVKDLTANSAVLQGSLQLAPSEAASGIVISGKEGQENVRAGVRIMASGINDNYEIKAEGLLPNTTYHYTAYLDLGNGTVYGEERSFTTPDAEFNPDKDLVDLGLSTKWAKYNVGATKATELGGLFGFGDMTGFQTSLDLDNYASADIYKTDRDVANKVYGSWVTMPTIDEFEELFTECKKEWVEEDGVAGYKFTGPNGNSIFLPAAGSRTQGTVSGEGLNGYYLSGSINVTDNKFAMAYSFDQNSNRRTTTPVYQALAIRPVSVAKNVKFDKTKLYNTWEFDLKPDESHYKFVGPVFFYGKDACWASYTNNQPVVGETTGWDAEYANIKSWAITDPNHCGGTMTFYMDEEGNDKVKVHQILADGSYKDSEGTFTVDAKGKTITMSVDPLNPVEYQGGITRTDETKIKVMSLSDESLQLDVIRSSDGQLMIYNYVTSDVKNGYVAKLTAWGDGGNWDGASTVVSGGSKAVGQYTVKLETTEARTNGKVYALAPEVIALAPRSIFLHQGKLIRLIEVNLYHQAILSCISRESSHIVIGFSNACTQALNYQGTLSIVATSSTNSIYHGLLILYYTSHSLSICPLLTLASLVHTRLIASCKEKMLVIVLKLVGNLSPDGLLLCIDDILLRSIEDVVFQPSIVPVRVENYVHIILNTPRNDTCHTVEPLGIDFK
jgi:hypothetical protein